MKHLWSLLRVSLLLAILLALALPLLLFAVLDSEAGTAWLLRQGSVLAGSQGHRLQIADSSGTLLGELELSGVVWDGAGTRFDVGQLRLRWRPWALLTRRVQIDAIELADVHLALPAAQPSEPTAPQIPDIALPISIRVDRFDLARLSVDQDGQLHRVDHARVAARMDSAGLALERLDLAAAGVALRGALAMQTTAPHPLDGRLALHVDASATGSEVGPVDVDLALRGEALRPALRVRVTSPWTLQLSGGFDLREVEPTFDLVAEWRHLAWPPLGPAIVDAGDGRLALVGRPDDYRLDLSTGLTGPGLPDTRVALDATGDLERIRLQPLEAVTLGGRVNANGQVGWSDGVAWDLEIDAEQIDPARFPTAPPALGGRLDARVSVSGRQEPAASGGVALRARIHQLNGRLQDHPVEASGELALQDGILTAERLRFLSGPNRFALDGRAGRALDLAFTVDAPELAALYPGLSGNMKGEGRVGGTRDAPTLVGRVDAAAIAYQDLALREFTLDLDWREGGGGGKLRAAGLAAAGQLLDTLQADLDGRPDAHRLTLSAEGEPGRLAVSAQGGLDGQVWSGTLDDLALRAPGVGEWRLQEATSLRVGADRVRAGRLCLGQRDARLCAAGGWAADAGIDLAGEIVAVDLASAGPYLPDGTTLEGRLDGSWALKGDPERPGATLDLRPGDGRFRFERDDGPLELAFRDVSLQGRFADDRGRADLNLALGPNGRARGRVELGPDVQGRRALDGTLSAEFPDLGLVAGFVPALQEVEGRLHLRAGVGGTLAEPRVNGGLTVSEARARLPDAGIELTDIEVAVRGRGDGPLQLDGRLASGEGHVTVTGSIDPTAAGGPAVDLAVSGERFQAVRLPEALVEISPELRLKGARPYRLSGRLVIPLARVEISEVPAGTVGVSDDEIVVGEQDVATAAGPRALTARVQVALGDQVTFEGFGLSTGLVGAVDAAVDERGTRVDGKIELRDGRYEAYGQDLAVERGRLLFAGPPANPELDLRALRVSRDGSVKAYLAMSGPLSKPRPRVYSEPSLPEAEALAYLLTGRGLDQAGRDEGVDIASAAASFGLAKGEPLLQEMGDRLGLDELRVDGGGGLEESSLILGKYLNPDLYLGYSQGLFNPEGAVLMRLRLHPRVEVETRSGNEQSVDLFYRYEHD